MKTIFIALFLLYSSVTFSQQYVWQQKNVTGITGGHAASGFALGNKLYYGLGQNSSFITSSQLWEFDPVTEVWAQMASLPGLARCGATSFVLNGFGYITCGWTTTQSATQLNDTWKYDPVNNSWLQVSNFPGSGRYTAAAFVIGNYAYVGTGYTPLKNDFYRYDPLNDTWSPIAQAPIAIQSAAAFELGGKGYLVAGHTSSGIIDDVFEYNPSLNVWTSKNNYPLPVAGAFVFKINGIVFCGLGLTSLGPPYIYTSNIYRYDSATDAWTYVSSFPSFGRSTAIGLSYNNDGFIYGGNNQTSGTVTPLNELWKFSTTTFLTDYNNSPLDFYYQNNQLCFNRSLIGMVSFKVYSLNGQLLSTLSKPVSENKLSLINLAKNSLYLFRMEIDNTVISGKFYSN
jgi:N-acetylneuraminic acid mutarotase